MSRYRRLHTPGASHFFTLCLARRGQTLLTDDIIRLRQAYADTLQGHYRLRTDAIVILPDHLHAVWTLPEGDADFPNRWRLIKTAFLKGHPPSVSTSQSKVARGEKGIWQRRYWHHLIRDDADFAAHIAYCWGNPVKHGLVTRAVDWSHSSLHRDIRLGRAASEWAGCAQDGKFGE